MYGRRAVTAAAHPDRGAADGAESVHEWTRLQFKRRLRESEEEEQEEEDARAAKQGRADALFPLPSFPSSRPSSPSSSWPPLAPLYSRLLRLSSKRVDAFTALMASHGSAACNTARQGGGQPARPKRKKEQQQQQRSPLTTATATPLDHPLSLASTAQLSSPSSQQCEVPTSSSSSSSSSSFSPSTSRAGGGVQSHLDFGQLVAGLTRCPDCLCTYHAGQAEDERLHAQQHQTHMHGPPFHGWKDECLVQPGGVSGVAAAATALPHAARLLCIRPTALSHPSRSTKVRDILHTLHTQLGSPTDSQQPPLRTREEAFDELLAPSSLSSSSSCSSPSSSSSACPLSSDQCLYLCVLHRRVVGALLLRSPAPCSRLLRVPVGGGEAAAAAGVGSEGADGRCSWQLSLLDADRCVAPMGVERVWVVSSWRRRGVARALLDAARHSLLYGVPVERHEVAFSQPTQDGRRLAQAYTQLTEFRAYAM